MEKKYRISTQGINKNITSSNGSYDSIEHGEYNFESAIELIDKCSRIGIMSEVSDIDFCPPNIIIECKGFEIQTFTIDKEGLIHNDSGTKVNPYQALKIVTGEKQFNLQETLKNERAEKGVVPVRKKNLNPTTKNLNPLLVDTGFNSPQFEMQVWKSRSWFEVARILPWVMGGFFLLIGLIIAGNKADAQYAPIPLLLGILFLFSGKPIKKAGKTILRMGFDWKTNTVWMKKGNNPLVFEPDANLMRNFNAVLNVTSRINSGWRIGEAKPLYTKEREWLITYLRSGSEHQWTMQKFSFATQKEVQEVLQNLNTLLIQQI